MALEKLRYNKDTKISHKIPFVQWPKENHFRNEVPSTRVAKNWTSPQQILQQSQNDFSVFFVNNKNGGSDCQPVANEFELKGCAGPWDEPSWPFFYLRQPHR